MQSKLKNIINDTMVRVEFAKPKKEKTYANADAYFTSGRNRAFNFDDLTIGEQLRVSRNIRFKTQAQLGRILGIPQAQISRIETGEIEPPAVHALRIIEFIETTVANMDEEALERVVTIVLSR